MTFKKFRNSLEVFDLWKVVKPYYDCTDGQQLIKENEIAMKLQPYSESQRMVVRALVDLYHGDFQTNINEVFFSLTISEWKKFSEILMSIKEDREIETHRRDYYDIAD